MDLEAGVRPLVRLDAYILRFARVGQDVNFPAAVRVHNLERRGRAVECYEFYLAVRR
jgi:hypothetical protein